MAEKIIEVGGKRYRLTGTPAQIASTEATMRAGRDADSRDTFLGAADALMRGLARGVSSDFVDELAARVNAVLPIDRLAGRDVKSMWDAGSSYSDAVKANENLEQRTDAADATANPIASNTGYIGGQIAQSVLGARAVGAGARAAAPLLSKSPALAKAAASTAKVASRTPDLVKVAAAGAAGGGVQGALAGAGQGTDAASRMDKAATAGGTGALFGAALAPSVALLAPAVAHYAKILFGKGATEEASDQLLRALQRDGFDVTTPQGLADLNKELARYGAKPVSLADVGNATRARAGVGLRTTSDAQSRSIRQVLARQSGQSERLVGDIKKTVSPRTDVHMLDDALVQQRADAALPLRQKALFEEVKQLGFTDAQINEILDKYVNGYIEQSPFHGPALSYAFRKGTLTPEQKTFLEKLTAVSRSAKPLRKTAEFYRGLPLSKEMLEKITKEGTLPHEIPFSVALDDELASMYVQGGDDQARALFKIKAPKGTRVRDISSLDPDVEEGGEHLLPPGVLKNIRRAAKDAFTDVPTYDADFVMDAVPPPPIRSRMVTDPVLQTLIHTDDAQKALTAAMARARSEVQLKSLLGQDVSMYPDLDTNGQVLDVRTFDWLKRFLDDEVNALYKRGDTATFKAGQAGQVRALRDAIRDRLKETVPEYGEYLDTYKGSSDLLDALRSGRDYRKLDPEEISKAVGDMTTGEREMYRVGVARDLTDQVHGTNDNAIPATRILPSVEAQRQLEATGIPNNGFNELMTRVMQERDLSKLTAELSGSQQAARIAAATDADAGARWQLPFNPGSSLGWAGAGVRTALNRASTVRNAGVNEAIMPMLLETNPQGILRIVENLQARGEFAKAAELQMRLLGTRSAGTAGGVVGAATVREEQ